MGTHRSPAFQFYPDKWQTHTRRLSDSAYRVYHELLCWMWLESPDYCSIEANACAVACAVAMPLDVVKAAIEEIQNPYWPLLQEKDGRYVSNGLKKEAVKQKDRREKAVFAANVKHGKRLEAADAAKSAAHARGTDANACAEQCFPSPSPTPFPSPEDQISDTNNPKSHWGAGAAGRDRGPLDSLVNRIADVINNPNRTRSEFLGAILELCGEPHWRQWWAACVAALAEKGGLDGLVELVRYVTEAQDPVTAERKGLTPFEHPNKVLVKGATEIMHRNGVRWPQFPKADGLNGKNGATRLAGNL